MRDMSVVNKTALGSMLRGTLKSRELASLIYEKGCGWLDGGCVTLGQAFKYWMRSDADTWCVHEGPVHHHVVARICGQDLYLDGDGLGSCEDVFEKMTRVEGLKGRLSIRPFDLENVPSDLTLWPEISMAVAEQLYRRLGPWPEVKRLYLPSLQMGIGAGGRDSEIREGALGDRG